MSGGSKQRNSLPQSQRPFAQRVAKSGMAAYSTRSVLSRKRWTFGTKRSYPEQGCGQMRTRGGLRAFLSGFPVEIRNGGHHPQGKPPFWGKSGEVSENCQNHRTPRRKQEEFLSLGRASIASGYTPSAGAGQTRLSPSPLKGEKGKTHRGRRDKRPLRFRSRIKAVCCQRLQTAERHRPAEPDGRSRTYAKK